MTGRLEGKTALITGASAGIGLGTAKRFAAEGARVYITARKQDALDVAVAAIGPNAIGIQGDAADLDDLDRLYAEISARGDRLDILFANAGAVGLATIGELTPEHFDTVSNVNFRGLVFTVAKALPVLRDRASIVLMGSTGGSEANAAMGIYGATKAAARSLARTWTLELKDRGIRVNTISPGPTRTEIAEASFTEEQMREHTATTPINRYATLDEVAAAVLFLASDEASYITGTELFVDGGRTQI
jgi:NAD(P)-dependent dehydrogenase (short-subunit alcohol dehydrogenase family)